MGSQKRGAAKIRAFSKLASQKPGPSRIRAAETRIPKN